MDPEELAAAYVTKADACVSAKRYEESLDLYDKAIEADPECGEAWTGKANALKMLGRFREALDCLERSIDIWPSPIAEALRETLIGELKRRGLIR